jgi:amino acid transporter
MSSRNTPPAESPPAQAPQGEVAAPPASAEAPQAAPKFKGFGTFMGVYLPSLLTILGVIMFLRLGWVVGQAGLTWTLIIVTLATSITLITGLSISATATNMRVRGGGAYFMISRSFGIESGAAIGLPLYLAQATGVAFYLAGFAESVHSLLPQFSPQAIGLVALVVTTALAYLSADLALKTQLVILLLILAALASFLAGQPLPGAGTPAPLPSTVPFWAVFAVFFPAVTGIEAGLSMSGNLRNPGRSLPLGTIGAILTGYGVYLAIPVLLWRTVPATTLRENTMVMWEVARWPQAIYLGIWGATLSSAMGALLGGSRTLQALARDRVVPRFLGRGYGTGDDPRLATLITFAIGAAGITLGTLDLIAPVLSMFFLTSYGTLNLIAALEGVIGNPSWRPTFRTPWKLSLAGAGLCLATMLMIDPGASITAIVACSGVYLVMRRRRLSSRWSDIRGGILQALARYSIYTLSRHRTAARTWRPNILLFSGVPKSRWYLVELADAITQGKGFLTIATILEREFMEEEKVSGLERSFQDYLRRNRVPALVRVKYSEDREAGMEGLIQDYGLGLIEPNTVMMGESEEAGRIVGFCRVLKFVFYQEKNLVIVRDSAHVLEEGVPEHERTAIDIWFTSQSNNSTLMLVFAYMLQSSPEWRGATLTIKSLVANEEGRRGLQESLEAFQAASRIDADIEVHVQRPDQSAFSEIGVHSREADIVFIGLREPSQEETPEEYSRYYRDLLEATRDFPLTMITLAGQKLSFKEIFE